MKLFIITYSTSERNGSFAIKDKAGRNSWLYKEIASKVLKETFEDEIEERGDVFDAQCYDTNARIEYEDDTWAEYRLIQVTAPVLDETSCDEITYEMQINQAMEDCIDKELSEEEAARIRGFMENAYFHDESCLPLEDYASVINSKLEDGKTVEEICSQSKWDFLREVASFNFGNN